MSDESVMIKKNNKMERNANIRNTGKKKTYIITLSRYFQKGHPRAGEPTEFADKFLLGQNLTDDKCVLCRVSRGELWRKIHTIRGNYDLWAKRISEVQSGDAVLSIRQWTGRPYNSLQVTLATLTAEHGVGVQKVVFDEWGEYSIRQMRGIRAPKYRLDNAPRGFLDVEQIAYNDGLSFDDFADWFSGVNTADPLAIIHFTNFRY